MKNEKNVGRPSKKKSWLVELSKILQSENIIFLSDKDLIVLVNRELPEQNKITSRTFMNWKSGKYNQDDELAKEFMDCIEFALIRQKQMLGERLMNDLTGQWTRYAWILERKFSEWNLKHISENINRNEQAATINITAGSVEQKTLIENIINGDFVEIKPTQLYSKNEVEQTDNDDDDIEF